MFIYLLLKKFLIFEMFEIKVISVFVVFVDTASTE